MSGDKPWREIRHKATSAAVTEEARSLLDWTIRVETPGETTRDDAALARFHDSLTGNAIALAPAASMNGETRTLSAASTSSFATAWRRISALVSSHDRPTVWRAERTQRPRPQPFRSDGAEVALAWASAA